MLRVSLTAFVQRNRSAVHRCFCIKSFDGEVEEFLDRHLAKKTKDSPSVSVSTTRREVLSLYREIFRYSILFTWTDENGREWRDILRSAARDEFRQHQFETDPEKIAQLLVNGRQQLSDILNKFLEKQTSLVQGNDPSNQSPPNT